MSKKTEEPTAENVFKMFEGGKGDTTQPAPTDTIPTNSYEITDIDGDMYGAEGFLIFTAQHVAIMRDEGAGAIPVLVMSLNRLKVAELTEEVVD